MIRIGSKVIVRAERTKKVGTVFDIRTGQFTGLTMYSVEFPRKDNPSLGFYFREEIEEVHE